MEKIDVVFDTNIINNKGFNTYFGQQDKLKSLSDKINIIIPDIVISEIEKHKRIYYETQYKEFENNIFFKHNETSINIFEFEDKVARLKSCTPFKYQLISINRPEVLKEIKDLSINNEPPFHDGCDKGFKDTYIYYATLEYMHENDIEIIYVCCRDGRLKQAYGKYPNIRIVSSVNEISDYLISRYQDDYFINRVIQELGLSAIPDWDIWNTKINDFFINYEGNDVIIVNDNENYSSSILAVVDKKEIISDEYADKVLDVIDRLLGCKSFEFSHAYMEELSQYVAYISPDNIRDIFHNMAHYHPLSYLVNDDDFKDFIYKTKDYIRLYANSEDIEKYNKNAEIKII